jgi:predicted anti-sigma-YlaC factor YlaD
MNCREVERLLTEDINQGNDARVRKHLDRCSICSKLHRELNSLSEMSRLLQELDKAPVDFSSQIYERLARPLLWQLQWKPFLVLGLVILGLVSFLWIQEVQPAPEAMLVPGETPQEDPFARVKDGDLELIDGDQVEGPYVDVILKSPSEPEYILRLPFRIRVRTSDVNQDIYLNNASY